MRALIQRVTKASCTIDNKLHSSIDKGFLIFLGIKSTDTEKELDYIVKKIKNLRIFEDENGKTNLSLLQVNGSILLISQFTLYANTIKSNRPSFIQAATPDIAKPLYEKAITLLSNDFKVQSGIFGADMKIELVNDGPFTILIEN